MQSKGNVFVVDDDRAIREALERLFEEVDLPVRTFGSAGDFLADHDSDGPSCIVLDVRMPGMSGIELHKKLTADNNTIPVIIITGHGDIQMAVDAVRMGAVDFIEKPFKPQRLLDCVQKCLVESMRRLQIKVARDALAARFARLTVREREVVELVVTGMTNKQIAAQLDVSSQAIDARRMKAMGKLQANNIPELVKVALEAGAL